MTDLHLINLGQPSETRHFEKGRFDIYRIGPATLGRARMVETKAKPLRSVATGWPFSSG
jgi:hypothetical protein